MKPWVLLVSILAASWAVPAQNLPAGYAGEEACSACHEEIAKAFPKNPHARLDKPGRWKATPGAACEACHGPGAAHAESAEPEKIYPFKADPARINQTCLGCHSGSHSQRGRLQGAHNRNTLDCTACHSVHSSTERPLLRRASNELCSTCHPAARAAFNRPFHHKLPEGAMRCVNCHDPHGNRAPASLNRVSGNDPACVQCHADKRGPFPFEHAAVKLEPCSSCHEPHGSSNPRLLTRHTVGQLCLECHTTSLSTLGGPPTGFHDLRTARFQNCTVCHSRIHGSYVNKDFLR